MQMEDFVLNGCKRIMVEVLFWKSQTSMSGQRSEGREKKASRIDGSWGFACGDDYIRDPSLI